MRRPSTVSRIAFVSSFIFVAGMQPPARGQCPCFCPADVSGNTLRDGLDIDGFVRCVLGGPAVGGGCGCADMNGDSAVDQLDIASFITSVLAKAPVCSVSQALYEPGPTQTPPASPCREAGSCGGMADRGVANSIYFFSGEFFHSATDLWIRGRGLDFVWARKYRSRNGPTTAMGSGWDFSYNIYIEASGANRILHDGNTRTDLYTLQVNGKWARDEFFRELQINGDSTYTLTFADTGKWNFRTLTNPIAPGRVASIVDRNGNTLLFAYDGSGRLATITDTLNRNITVAYDVNNRISSVTDFNGRQIIYTYDANGDLRSVRSPTVTGTPNGNDFPTGKTTMFTYSSGFADSRLNHNLLTITDPKGQTYLQNVYASTLNPADLNFDRLVRQTWGNFGDIIDIAYIAQSSCGGNNFAAIKAIVNDRVGDVKEFYYSAVNTLVMAREYTGRAIANLQTTESSNRPTNKLRPSDPDYFETRWTYNADAMATLITYANLNSMAMSYELTLDPSAARRIRGNLRQVTRSPGPLGGDQVSIAESYTYETGFGGCGCETNFVKTHTDGRGSTETHTYDAAGNRTHTDHRPGGGVEDWTYNAFGQMATHTLAANGSGSRRVDSYTYYAAGIMNGYLQSVVIDSGIAPRFNLTTQYEYDARGNTLRMIHPNGSDTLYTLNELDEIVRQLSREVTSGSGIRYEKLAWYDANDYVIRVDIENRDESGIVQPNTHWSTVYEYGDILNWLTRVCVERLDSFLTNSDLICAGFPFGFAVTTEYQYDANRNRTLIRSPQAVSGADFFNTVTRRHDERDLAFQSVRAAGSGDQSTDQMDYDGNGNIKSVSHGLESSPRVTQFALDGFDRRTSTTDPMGNVTTLHYDANGNLNSQRIDGEVNDVPGGGGNVRLGATTYQYNAMDLRTRRDTAHFDIQTQIDIGDGQSSTLWTYADNLQITSRTDDLPGHVTTVVYDTAYRPAVAMDGKGNQLRYEKADGSSGYDADSNIVGLKQIDKSDLGNPDQIFNTTLVYDQLDRQTQHTDNLGNTQQYAYDSRGNRVLSIDPRGTRTRIEFDGLSRRLRTLIDMDGNGSFNDPADIVTQEAWNDNSMRTSQTDPNFNMSRYIHDSLDRVVRRENADCTIHLTQYDVHDDVTRTTDENGSIVDYIHDLLGRITNKAVQPGPGVSSDTTFESFGYAGRPGRDWIVSATNNFTLVQRRLDSLANILADTQQILGEPGGIPRIVAAQFNGESGLTQLDIAGNRTLLYARDVLNRVILINDLAPPALLVRLFYIGDRVERREDGNNTRSDIAYDAIGNTSSITHKRIGGPIFEQLAYIRDANQNTTTFDRVLPAPVDHQGCAYDRGDRLTQSTRTVSPSPACTTNYTLDLAGNRTNVAGCCNPGTYTMNGVLCMPGDQQMNRYTTRPAVGTPSTLFLNEPFNYPVGNLAGNGSWTAHSSAGIVPVQVIGGKAQLAQGPGSREDVNATLGTTMGTGQKFYAAFDLVNTGGNGQVFFAHFKDAGVTNFVSRVFITSNGFGDYTVGLSGSSGAPPSVTWATGLTFGTTYRIVTSYEYSTGKVELWVNPVDQSSTNITATGVVNLAINSYALRQVTPTVGVSNQTIDNLCVSDTFSAALNCGAASASTSCQYDANGNLIATFSVPKNYTYDYLNRLVRFFDAGTGLTTTYRYDALGRRVMKRIGGTFTRYLYYRWTEVAELDETGAFIATNVINVDPPAGGSEDDGPSPPPIPRQEVANPRPPLPRFPLPPRKPPPDGPRDPGPGKAPPPLPEGCEGAKGPGKAPPGAAWGPKEVQEPSGMQQAVLDPSGTIYTLRGRIPPWVAEVEAVAEMATATMDAEPAFVYKPRPQDLYPSIPAIPPGVKLDLSGPAISLHGPAEDPRGMLGQDQISIPFTGKRVDRNSPEGQEYIRNYEIDARFNHLIETLGTRRNGQDYSLHKDDHDNVRVITGPSGSVAEKRDYTCDFGNTAFFDGSGNPTPHSVTGIPWGYASYRLDPESSLYYCGMRYYEPESGRFITRDPIGIWGDPANLGNPYTYVANNPHTLSDPHGLKSLRKRLQKAIKWTVFHVVLPQVAPGVPWEAIYRADQHRRHRHRH